MIARRSLPAVPVTLLARAFPRVPPRRVQRSDPFPQRVVIAEAAVGPDGRAICGAYVGDGPDLDGVLGRFLGPAAPDGFDPPGGGPVRHVDNFLDRLIWRGVHESRFGGIAWDWASWVSSVAYTFKNGGTWAIVFTDPNPAGGRHVDYFRSPIVLAPKADGRVEVSFGPRKNPDARDFDDGRQYGGRFVSLKDAVSALSGEKVEDLATACVLFDLPAPPPGPAKVETLPSRITALRDLYRAVRAEADLWGLVLDRIPSATAIVSSAYGRVGIPQPLLRDRRTMRVPPRAIGAGIEATSIGARTGTFLRRVEAPGLDVDIASDYAVANALAGAQHFLTREVTAHHLSGRRSLAELTRMVTDVVPEALDRPEGGIRLAFLAKVRPADDVLTAHFDLFGIEATVTGPIAEGSAPFWTTGFDMAAAVVEDLDRGGSGRVPETIEAWTFSSGRRLRGLRPVTFPGGWTWDPRRDQAYRSVDGRTFGNLSLLFAAIRETSKSDPDLTDAATVRRRGMLKVACVAGGFGMFAATTPRSEVKSGTPHRVITSDGILTVYAGTAERPGPWAFPPAAALVEGAGRLLITLLLHEVRCRGGTVVQADTDGAFILATPEGGPVELTGSSVLALSFAQVQEIRDRFTPLARWTGLPIVPDRLDGLRLVRGEGSPSLLKFADPTVGPDGDLRAFRCYTPSLRRFLIHEDD